MSGLPVLTQLLCARRRSELVDGAVRGEGGGGGEAAASMSPSPVV